MKTEPQPHHVLLVDDEPSVRTALQLLLNVAGYRVEAVGSGKEALADLEKNHYDLLITDNRMGGMSGTDLAVAAKARRPAMPIVMYTGYAPSGPVPALDLLLLKAHDTPSLLEMLRQLLQRQPR